MNVIDPLVTSIVSTNVVNTVPVYASGATYSMGDDVYRPGNPEYVYRSSADLNADNTPEESADHWTQIGATNRTKMFDIYRHTQTENLDTLELTIATGKADRIAFFGLVGESVRVVVRNGATVISDEITTLRRDAQSRSWTEYLFKDITYRSTLIKPIGGLFRNLEIDITITAATGTLAKCGYCVVGLNEFVAAAEFGISNGLSSYSAPAFNDFGEYQISTRRRPGKIIDVPLWIDLSSDRSEIDRITQQMERWIDKPVVFDANNGGPIVESWILMGIYKDFYQVVPAPKYSKCNLEIRGIA